MGEAEGSPWRFASNYRYLVYIRAYRVLVIFDSLRLSPVSDLIAVDLLELFAFHDSEECCSKGSLQWIIIAEHDCAKRTTCRAQERQDSSEKLFPLSMECPSLEISFAKTTLCCPEVMSNSLFFKTLKTETTGTLLPSGVLNNFLQNLQMRSRCISPFQPFPANSSRAREFIDIPNRSSVNDWHMWHYLTGKITRGRDGGIKRMSTGSLPSFPAPAALSPDRAWLAPLADFSFRAKPHLGACSEASCVLVTKRFKMFALHTYTHTYFIYLSNAAFSSIICLYLRFFRIFR